MLQDKLPDLPESTSIQPDGHGFTDLGYQPEPGLASPHSMGRRGRFSSREKKKNR